MYIYIYNLTFFLTYVLTFCVTFSLACLQAQCSAFGARKVAKNSPGGSHLGEETEETKELMLRQNLETLTWQVNAESSFGEFTDWNLGFTRQDLRRGICHIRIL